MRFEYLSEMPPAERAEFVSELARDEVLRRDYAAWLAVSERLRREQDDLLGDRRLLVLSALHRAGLDSMLTEREQGLAAEFRLAVPEDPARRQLIEDVQRRIAHEAADFEESWRLREAHLIPFNTADRRTPGRSFVRTAWRVSAVAAVVAFVGILLYVAQRGAPWVEIHVAPGEVESLALVDGSTIRVIGPTSIRYQNEESGEVRPERVRLSGDAFFDIVPSTAPFVVETTNAQVAVVGTSFGVRGRSDRTDVVVAAGRVSVSSRTGSRDACILNPGESCFVARDDAPSQPQRVDLGEALAWANIFVFRATPMSEIAAALSRHYGVEVLVDTDLANRTVTGTFDRTRELEEILAVLSKTLGARTVEMPDGFRLVPGGA